MRHLSVAVAMIISAAMATTVVGAFTASFVSLPRFMPPATRLAPLETSARRCRRASSLAANSDADADADAEDSGEWTSLTDSSHAPFAVRKRVLEVASEGAPAVESGREVSIHYSGTLVGAGAGVSDWTARDAVECWLSTQQGVPEGVAESFLEKDVGGSKLTDGTFDDDFAGTELGVSNRMQCKKLVMAARRLAKQVEEYPEGGAEFDSSEERGPYKFVVGKGKAIKGMDLAVSTMRVGEKAEVICRSDYAYGKEGLRKSDGTVIVPPYATLRFEIDLLESQ
uniref:peptidylprolyl isomerase n=1 Tax=Trieres chinensis TaxID=1514140 RepID=A0A7S1YXR4_TRICV